MNRQQLADVLKAPEKAPDIISIKDLKNKSSRTLLWGYTTDRRSHHVYIADGKLHVYVYVYGGRIEPEYRYYDSGVLKLSSVVPNKRLYPEACDYEFCLLLKEKNIYLPFTTFNSEREHKQYHGTVH